MSDTAQSMNMSTREENGSTVFLKIMAGVLAVLGLMIGFLVYVNTCSSEIRRESATIYATKDAFASLKEDIEQVRKEVVASRAERREDMTRLSDKIDKIAIAENK